MAWDRLSIVFQDRRTLTRIGEGASLLLSRLAHDVRAGWAVISASA